MAYKRQDVGIKGRHIHKKCLNFVDLRIGREGFMRCLLLHAKRDHKDSPFSVLPLAKLELGPGTNSSRKKASGPSQDEFVEYTIYNTKMQ